MAGQYPRDGIRLRPPDKYDGETDFEHFAKLLRAYMGCEERIYEAMLQAAADKGSEPFTYAQMQHFAAEAHTKFNKSEE